MKTETALSELSEFVANELHGCELSGYAASDAAKALLTHWTRAVADGNSDNLIKDVDLTIETLMSFKQESISKLPLKNGGLQGLTVSRWISILKERGFEVYEVVDQVDSTYRFSGPGFEYDFDQPPTDYPSMEEATIAAAVAAGFATA